VQKVRYPGFTHGCARDSTKFRNYFLSISAKACPSLEGLSAVSVAGTFWVIIPATKQAIEQDVPVQVISCCRTARSAKKMMDSLGLKHRENFISEILKHLLIKKGNRMIICRGHICY
jgi:hypothetical protein